LATFHWTDPLAVGQLQDVYGLNDGHDYTAVDLGAPFSEGAILNLAITGKILTGSRGPAPPIFDCRAIGYHRTATAPPSTVAWYDQYDGLGGGDDQPTAVWSTGVVQQEGDGCGHSWTWVTGGSIGTTGNSDVVTLGYEYIDCHTGGP